MNKITDDDDKAAVAVVKKVLTYTHRPLCAKVTDGKAICTCGPVPVEGLPGIEGEVSFNEKLARAALASAMRHAAQLDLRLKMRIQTPINFQAEMLALVQQNLKLTIMLMDQMLILATGKAEVVQMKRSDAEPNP